VAADINLPMGKRKLKIVGLDTVHDLAEGALAQIATRLVAQ
jgi:hypothetical protein